MGEADAGDGLVYASDGRKVRKPRLSSEQMIPEEKAPVESTPPTPNFPALSFLVASMITMLAFQSEWPRKCGISGDGSPVPPEYAAPAFGFMAAMIVQQIPAIVVRNAYV